MAESKVARGLEPLIKNLSRLVGKFQVGVNKILWGKSNVQPITGVAFGPTATSNGSNVLSYTSQIPTQPSNTALDGSKFRNFAQSGVFNILNALNSVDLCDILTYAYDNINIKKKPRKPLEQQTDFDKALYEIQDLAGEAVKKIDKYTAYPNVFITSFLGVGPDPVPPLIAQQDTNAPTQGGTGVQKYNTYFLMQSLRETLAFAGGPNSLLTPEEVNLLSAVPGLSSKITYIRDFLGIADQYTSYTQIPDERLQLIIQRINQVRSICVAIQALDFRDPRALVNVAANFLGVDIRSQIQRLSQYIDPTRIVPTIKQITNALNAFIRIANQVEGFISLGQFFIKLGILFYKIFKFIILFFSKLAIPSIFGTVGTNVTIQNQVNRAKDEADGLIRFLRSVNALLTVVVVFVKYLLVNTVELLARVEILLTKLRGCESMQGSDVLYELEQTYTKLTELKDRLEIFVINFESRTSPNTAEFGKYQIRVVDEQVVESTIVNRRRRGIALDINGIIVAQSDLTFATNTAVIIEEVKQKLVSQGLVAPTVPLLDADSIATITESLSYLETSDVLDNNLNISAPDVEAPDNLDENQGLGLQAFINNLPGGRRLRQRTRRRVSEQQAQSTTQIDQERRAAQQSLNIQRTP